MNGLGNITQIIVLISDARIAHLYYQDEMKSISMDRELGAGCWVLGDTEVGELWVSSS